MKGKYTSIDNKNQIYIQIKILISNLNFDTIMYVHIKFNKYFSNKPILVL